MSPYQPEPSTHPVMAVVADDDDDARELMASALRRAGFGVREARATAWESVDTVRDNAGSRMVVVSDIGMPRTDGIAATVALRASKPEIRIVLVTAFADGQTLRRARSAGADRVLLKPLELEVLVDIALDLARTYQ